MSVAFEIRRFRSFDGTDLAFQTGVEGQGRPPLVLANGLGGTFNSWTPFFEHFGRRYHIVSWDYRGLYDSRPPADRTALTVAHHARDLAALLEHLEIRRAVFVGWSMGVQVLLEHYGRAPDTVAGLVLINGVPGRPFDTAFGAPLSRYLVINPSLALMARRPRELGAIMRWAVRRRELIPLLRGLGMLGSAADPRLVAELVEQFGQLDLEIYGEIMRLLGEHDANHVLDRIHVPVQIITGARDLFTPRRTAKRMARRIPDARLLIVPGGTHYTPVEAPDQVNPCVERFLAEIGYTGEANGAGRARRHGHGSP